MDPVIILWAGGALVLILTVVGIVVSISSRRSTEEERLGEYVEPEKEAFAPKREASTPVTMKAKITIKATNSPGLSLRSAWANSLPSLSP